jgi:hypothetical protein
MLTTNDPSKQDTAMLNKLTLSAVGAAILGSKPEPLVPTSAPLVPSADVDFRGVLTGGGRQNLN